MFSAQQPQTELNNWLLLLRNTLGIQDLDQSDLTISETEHTVTIVTSNATLAERLNVVLKSPKTIYTSLRYNIKSEASAKQTLAEEDGKYPQIPKLDELLNFNFIDHFFAPELHRKIGVQWKSDIKESDHYVICFEIDLLLQTLTIEQLKLYKQCLANASLTELRNALTFATEHCPLNKLPDIAKAAGPLANVVDKIIYTTKDSQGKPIACFDIKLLCYCLTPPVMQVIPIATGSQAEPQFHIEINKTHFISYLSTILPEGFVLHLQEHPTRPGSQLAFPICFNLERTIPLENVISFVLDKSGSMEDCFPQYIKEVKEFIGELKEQSIHHVALQNTTIRIRAFSDQSTVRKFSLQTDIASIFEYLDELKADGKTYLYGAVAEEFSALEPNFSDKNITFVVFTDGADNVNTESSLAILNEKNMRFKEQVEPPKVFTFGLGKNYDENGLRKLSDLSGNQHTRLNVIREFKKGLTTHLDSYCTTVKLVRFVQQQVDNNLQVLEERQSQFSLKIREGQIVHAAANQTLVVPGSFTVNDETYTVAAIPAVELRGLSELLSSTRAIETEVPGEQSLQTGSGAPILSQFHPRSRPAAATRQDNDNSRNKNKGWCILV